MLRARGEVEIWGITTDTVVLLSAVGTPNVSTYMGFLASMQWAAEHLNDCYTPGLKMEFTRAFRGSGGVQNVTGRVGSGSVQNLMGRVGSGQEIFKSRGSGQVGLRLF